MGTRRRPKADAWLRLITTLLALAALFALTALRSVVLPSTGVRTARAQSAAKPATSSSAAASATAKPTVVASTSAAPAPAVTAAAAASPVALIGTNTHVLVFGDSFVAAGFGQRIKKLVEARGGKVVFDAWTSSTTIAWAGGSRLNKLLATFKPDVVIISIGANEVFLPAPESRAQFVRSIVKRLGAQSCMWVGTPLWKGETGITAVTKANAYPCGFFDSNGIGIERGTDKIHPSPKGGAAWADAVWSAFVKDAGKP